MSPALARLCLAGAMLTVGGTVIAGKLIGAALPPFTAAALRFALALPCFLLLLRGRRWIWPDRHDACLLVVQAPVAAVLLSASLLHESVSGFQGLGLALVLLAVLLPASGLARQRKA